jgi:type III restriction enzyme
MALHKDFPASPFEILDPKIRWFPADETLRGTTMDKLMPPLVPELRRKVQDWRNKGYAGATETSRSLLDWWFQRQHLIDGPGRVQAEFRYFFSQREALETIIYLYDVVGVKDKYDLMRFDVSGHVSATQFDENWRRFVIKMATGTGKTKVMSLVLAWSYFHRLYETGSKLARNFLVIAPNIIVLDRIYKDFKGLRIFYDDPVLPDNGFDGHDWQNDFQLRLHLQDEVRNVGPIGNIFLTNIHRVYTGDEMIPTADDDDTTDYFLGTKPTGKTGDSKVDLGVLIRDIDELVVINDEAHHIHDRNLAWFKSIQDIHHRLLQKDGELALQIDLTATPKHNNGGIFVQTVSDYPLVEAIAQNVVKHPVLPDAASQSKLQERTSSKFTEKYADYLNLGVIEWRKVYQEHEKMGKKAILFVMTDDTKNCDDVAEYLSGTYQDLKDSVLVIHTKKNGEVSESSSGAGKSELEQLRKQANEIDSFTSPYKAIVSVLMLKEGWDVKNVTTIVGLRSYSSKSNILPEQTLGRGLRKMYAEGEEEYVSVLGTPAFMDFVESIKAEGVVLERKPMGEGTQPNAPIVVEVDQANINKNLDELDIEIPLLTPRIYRDYKNLSEIDVLKFGHQRIFFQEFTAEEQRQIVFKKIATDEISHTSELDSISVSDYRSVIGYFAQQVMRDLRLFSGFDILYSKVKDFVREDLFDRVVDLEEINTLRNLSELAATRTILESFKKAINELTVMDKGEAEIRDTIKLRETRPFQVKQQGYLVAKKSIFNKIIGDSHFELEFAGFLENCPDVISYAKNFLAVGFKLDYVKANGDISNYIPDFLVKLPGNRLVIVETKGQVDIDVPRKMERLRQWCEDVNKAQSDVVHDFAYVDQEGFERGRPVNFTSLIKAFVDYKAPSNHEKVKTQAINTGEEEFALKTDHSGLKPGNFLKG